MYIHDLYRAIYQAGLRALKEDPPGSVPSPRELAEALRVAEEAVFLEGRVNLQDLAKRYPRTARAMRFFMKHPEIANLWMEVAALTAHDVGFAPWEIREIKELAIAQAGRRIRLYEG